MFSVDTEQEAHELLVRTCPTNIRGEFIAGELAGEQTLENLWAFGDRLRAAYADMKASESRSTTT